MCGHLGSSLFETSLFLSCRVRQRNNTQPPPLGELLPYWAPSLRHDVLLLERLFRVEGVALFVRRLSVEECMLVIGFSQTWIFAMNRDDWIGLLPRPMGYMFEVVSNMTSKALERPEGTTAPTGMLQWVMYLQIQCEGWFSSGLFGVIGRTTGWASSKICVIALGSQSCETLQNTLTFILALLILAMFLYGLDWLFRPVLWLLSRVGRLYRYLRGTPEDMTSSTLEDCEWHGPTTDMPANNDHYKDAIRARSPDSRKPNHLIICTNLGYVRCSRTANPVRTANRHGQLFEVDEVISASSQAARKEVTEQVGHKICLCRHLVCGQTENALHVKQYAGIDADLIMDLRDNSYSITWWCCIRTCRWVKAIRFGCMPNMCRRRCKPCGKGRNAAARKGKHPDSDSEIEEESSCKADCVGW